MEGEAVILNLTNGVYYTLDSVGTVIWEELMTGKGLDEIVAVVCERFAEDATVIRGDLEELLGHLKEEHLVG